MNCIQLKSPLVEALVLVVMLSSCSVVMAAKGSRAPTLSGIHPGSTRAEVEMALGAPDSTIAREHGSTSIYQFEIDNEPSPGRAVAHGAMDVLTLGIWEAIGTPIELASGENQVVAIEFDDEGRVVSVQAARRKK